MIITISTSGGFAGFAAATKQKSVDTQALAPALRDDVCRKFAPDSLARLSAEKENPDAADRFTYHIAVTDDTGRTHRFDITEGALPAEMLDMIDGF